MAPDPARGGVVLFGGYEASNTADNDTWLFSNLNWTNLTPTLPSSPSSRWGASLVWDPQGPYALLFGGRNFTSFLNDTWELDGSGWHAIPTPVAPSPRAFYAVFYDPLVSAVVLFGGANTTSGTWVSNNETWFWSGGHWANRTAAFVPAPPPTYAAYNDWEPKTNRGVLYGGGSAVGCATTAATWEFGTGWNLSATSATNPGTFYGGAGASDNASGEFVMFSGLTPGSLSCLPRPITWERVAGNWTNLTGSVAGSSGTPPGRCCAMMAYDQPDATLVLFGGNGYTLGSAYLNDTWTLQSPGNPVRVHLNATPTSGVAPLQVNLTSELLGGSGVYWYNWSFGDGTPNATSENVSHRFGFPGTFSVVWSARNSSGAFFTETLTIDVLPPSSRYGWTQIGTSLSVGPSVRAQVFSAYDPQWGGVVLFGGYDPNAGAALGDTWLFANGTWTNLTATLPNFASPNPRWGTSLTWDPRGPYLVLFGGHSSLGDYNDTWILNRTGWYLLPTPVAPSPRGFAASFYDPTLASMVLFGGTCLCGSSTWRDFNDTWTFAHGAWKNVSSRMMHTPAARDFPYYGWDPSLGAAVLFGGQPLGGSCSGTNDTWLFTTGWNQSSPLDSPGGYVGAQAAYDGFDNAFEFYSGYTNPFCTAVPGMWAYANNTWTNLTPTLNRSYSLPPARCCDALSYDPVQRILVLFGGNTVTGYANDTWTYPAVPFVGSAVASATTGIRPLTVNFTGSATGGVGPYSYNWSFGDGLANATTADSSHQYANPGTYNATFHATDMQNRSLNVSFRVVVVLPISASVSASVTLGEVPQIVNFTAPLTGGASPFTYSWHFGDGSTSTSPAPSHTYHQSGTYNVTVTVHDALAETAASNVTVVILPAVAIAFGSPTHEGIVPYAAQFATNTTGGSAPYTYEWQFGDGQSGPGNATPWHTYGLAGTYLANVTVTDGLGHESGASTVVLAANPLTAKIGAVPSGGTGPLTVTLSATANGGIGAYSYRWEFGDGSPALTGPAQTSHTYTTAGDFQVNLTVNDTFGESVTTSLAIPVVAPLSARVTVSPTVAERNANVSFVAQVAGGAAPLTYSWSFGDGQSSSVPAPVHAYSTAGHYTGYLAVTDALGELAHAPFAVTVVNPLTALVQVSPSNATAGQTNVTVQALVTGGLAPYSYAWSGYPAGCTPGNVSRFSCVPALSGTFSISVEVTDLAGGHANQSASLEVSPSPPGTSGGGASGPGGLPWWVFFAIAAVAVGAAIAGILLWRRRGRAAAAGEGSATPGVPSAEASPGETEAAASNTGPDSEVPPPE